MKAPRTVVVVEASFVEELAKRVEALEGKATSSAGAPTHFCQADGHRPAWLPTKNTFLRAHAELRKKGDPGALVVGKTRLLTREAALRWLDAHRDRPPLRQVASPMRDVDRELDQAFGIRTRGAGGGR